MNQSEKRIEILMALGYRLDRRGGGEGRLTEWHILRPDDSEIDVMYISEKAAWGLLSEKMDVFTDLNAAIECVAKAREWDYGMELFAGRGLDIYECEFYGAQRKVVEASHVNPATAIAEAFWNLLQERKQ